MTRLTSSVSTDEAGVVSEVSGPTPRNPGSVSEKAGPAPEKPGPTRCIVLKKENGTAGMTVGTACGIDGHAITRIQCGSVAERAGMQTGDEVRSPNGSSFSG